MTDPSTNVSPEDQRGPATNSSTRQPNVARTKRSKKRWLIIALSAVLSVAAVYAAAVYSVTDCLPAPTGPFAVGRTTFYWTDTARRERQSAGPDDIRQVRANIWYPAELNADQHRAAYCPDFEQTESYLGRERRVLGKVRTHSFIDPPLATAKPAFPVVLFSPGFMQNGTDYTALVEELVSHGFVVVTLDHPFQSRAMALSDGRVVLPRETQQQAQLDPKSRAEDYRARVDVRVEDLRFVLDELGRLNAAADSRFHGKFDLKRVGVAGHSIGGVAAPQACMADARFKAAINLDGHVNSLPFFPDAGGRGPRQAFLELTDGERPPSDEQLAKWKVTREEFEKSQAEGEGRYSAVMHMIDGGGYRVTLADLTHESFSDDWLWYPGPLAERHRKVQIMRDVVRAFFEKQLLGQAAPILDDPALRSPEMRIGQF